jgi:hypothetical protein
LDPSDCEFNPIFRDFGFGAPGKAWSVSQAERSLPLKWSAHQGSRASVWNRSNPRHEALQSEIMSRSESEPGSASLEKK